jgi:Lar family restriction alleviation protein
MEQTLKPCPFCGSDKLKVDNRKGTYSIRCNRCHARGCTSSTWSNNNTVSEEDAINKAVELWNRRVNLNGIH